MAGKDPLLAASKSDRVDLAESDVFDGEGEDKAGTGGGETCLVTDGGTCSSATEASGVGVSLGESVAGGLD